MTWIRYVKTLVLTVLIFGTSLYLCVLLVDPYGNVPFSIPYDREPVTGNRRFATPALARSDRFDSVITGASTLRNLRPNQLNRLLEASFVNLSIVNGTPYEQGQILQVFVRHHPGIRYAILGIEDSRWCGLGKRYRKFFAGDPFPDWMYDDDQWNDLLYLFNWTALEMGWRQFRSMIGLRKPRYGRDGYHRFPALEEVYDLNRARRRIYGDATPHVGPPIQPPRTVSVEARARWTMPTLELLNQMLASLPESTTKVILLPPRHHVAVPVPGSLAEVQANECRRRLARLATHYQKAMVVDFVFRSRLAMEDRYYWDAVHYTEEAATMIGAGIARALTTQRGEPGLFDVLGRRSPDVAMH